jgi:nucleotide-binding universal stress UspA family protein
VFNRVLLCYDGSAAGRRALRRGAELAILLNAEVHVLSIVPAGAEDSMVIAGAAGYTCLVDDDADARKMLNESIAWLKGRGVSAEGYLARGDTIDNIIAYEKKLKIDLIVLGHYPRASGGFWWSGSKRATLADRVHCCIFVAVSALDSPESVDTHQDDE